MAGHSKWANIKHKKKVNDVKKSKLFSKLASEIKASINYSSTDVNNNLKLKKAVDKALSNNMGKCIINNILSNSSRVQQDKIIYSAIGENGISIVIECFNINKNRMVGELRHLFGKYGMDLIDFKSLEYIYFKLEKILILNEYNDKILFSLIDVNLYNISNNALFVKKTICKIIMDILKKMNINFESSFIYCPKKKVKTSNETFLKTSELISKIRKLPYFFNIFFNF